MSKDMQEGIGMGIVFALLIAVMTSEAPKEIDYENESIADIVEKIEYAIEQHPSFLKVIPQDVLEEKERLNRELRDW